MMFVHDSFDSFLEGGRTEIDQQAYRQTRQSQIGEQLLVVDRGQALDRLQFHNQDTLNKQVGAKTFIEGLSAKLDRHRLLPNHFQSPVRESPGQNDFVDRFKQTWSQVTMDVVGHIDHDR